MKSENGRVPGAEPDNAEEEADDGLAHVAGTEGDDKGSFDMSEKITPEKILSD
jgi:hypothetical protein